MHFLDTDFKKRRVPKRNTIQKTQNDLTVCLDLAKFKKLKKVLYEQFHTGFEKDSIIIKKGEYTNVLPEHLMEFIHRQIKNLSKDDLELIFKNLQKLIEEYALLYAKEYDKYIEELFEETKNTLTRDLILNFLNSIDKPLDNLELADENSKYQMELDIADSFLSTIKIDFKELLDSYFHQDAKKGIDLSKELPKLIRLADLKESLTNFFEKFAISDAFQDIYELYRNNQLMDKTDLYLYFYELGLGKEKFPVFYVPVSVMQDDAKFTLSFDKRIFINTKAVDFVVQEFNEQTENKSTLSGALERITYLSDVDDPSAAISHVVQTLTNFFGFSKEINISDPADQRIVNLSANFSNKSYLFLFDKSDEALINDYEEILSGEGNLLGAFTELIGQFIHENPASFVEEVEREWDGLPIGDRLVIESPIPLNEEQKQVVMALRKPDCKVLILEGPPGTGKSHTITAVICNALLEGKSVLVLSDKKEALDVVEDKITETLNKVRHEDDFQNPILRLGRTGNKFSSIVQESTIQKIKEHNRTYKNGKEEFEKKLQDHMTGAKANVLENVEYFKGIRIADIQFYYKNDSRFGSIEWINESEGKENPNLADALLHLEESLGRIPEIHSLHLKSSTLSEATLQKLRMLLESYASLQALREQVGQIEPYEEEISIIEGYTTKDRALFRKEAEDLHMALAALTSDFEVIAKHFKKVKPNKVSLSTFLKECGLILRIAELHDAVQSYAPNAISSDVMNVSELTPASLPKLKRYIEEIQTLRRPIIGYLGRKESIENLTKNLKKQHPSFSLAEPQKQLAKLLRLVDVLEFLQSQISPNESNVPFGEVLRLLVAVEKKEIKLEELNRITSSMKSAIDAFQEFSTDYAAFDIERVATYTALVDVIALTDVIQSHRSFITDEKLPLETAPAYLRSKPLEADIAWLKAAILEFDELWQIKTDIEAVQTFISSYPQTAANLKLSSDAAINIWKSSALFDLSSEEFREYIQFKNIENVILNAFNRPPADNYFDSMNEIEELVTVKMTNFLDERIIDFTENCRNDVQTLKGIIRKKKEFPKELFAKMKKAFPCILAGIRDYAEYIPLEQDLFDLIIIDEASQVSIAQALPALIRGKKIIVLGDEKQFSNVKSSNASNVQNSEYKSKLKKVFLEAISKKSSHLEKLAKFDIKISILDFSGFIANYRCMLRKHFRCYPEIISYSDKHFYNNYLQCMKIRGKPLDEVIRFDVIPHDGKFDQYKNVNIAEVDYILEKMREFKKQGVVQSLGIITPHTEQQRMLFQKINEAPERDFFFNDCKLKIMTFDTCQGEERDYIFYSMVATREKDRLNHIFLKSFGTIQDEVEGKIRAQRLNVGFSRAKECMHFILSKPVEEFHDGELRNALLHYQRELEDGKKRIIGGTDKNSPMELDVQVYFHQTKFYKDNKDVIELIPQFPIGEYLRQIHRNYRHPDYKVDFLLIFEGGKYIIEYDGFKEHFGHVENLEDINGGNYESYMSDDDVYRQKVLEGYGYRFLRLNRFNLGRDPVDKLNSMLESFLRKKKVSTALRSRVITSKLNA